jgi:hypothetical protein
MRQDQPKLAKDNDMNSLLAGDRVFCKVMAGVYAVVELNYDGSCVIAGSDGHTHTVHTNTLTKV